MELPHNSTIIYYLDMFECIEKKINFERSVLEILSNVNIIELIITNNRSNNRTSMIKSIKFPSETLK